MNQEEEVPTRVTRGALRRRSIDQDAAPPNPQTTSTTVAGSTPKKSGSTAKKGSTLGAIQETQDRPSTPVGGGRISRRRMSETIDTPTTAPNKLVQNLKDSEAVVGSGSGRRSRNTSLTLTEENVRELEADMEGTNNTTTTTTGTTGRTRTPARLRSSHETLTNTTPQGPPTGVRRSTRRNSVTSDDGSVQSLPITTPKTPVVRSLKAETILEEDSSGGDRGESDSSPRKPATPNQQQPGTPKLFAKSPRALTPSPQLAIKQEKTPSPRGSVSPRPSSAARKPPNSTPRSKNVSFTDDSKQDDQQSAYPKTPTSPKRKFVLVGVNDLRNTPLISGTPKANAVITLNGSDDKQTSARKDQLEAKEPSPSVAENETPPVDATTTAIDAEKSEQKQPKSDTKTVASSPAPAAETPSPDCASPSDGPTIDRSLTMERSNDVSGIEVLESSLVVQDVVNTSSTSNAAAQPVAEGYKFSRYWSHSVRGSNTNGIDAFSVRKQEEKQSKESKEELNVSTEQKGSAKKQQPQSVKDSEDDEEDENDAERLSRCELIDDEAMEVDGYQSGDSLDEETKREIKENEIQDHGEDLGSDDTEEEGDHDDEEEGDDERDSFIVSDDDGDDDDVEVLDEDALLESTGDELAVSPAKVTPKQRTPTRRRIVQMDDSDSDSDEGENASANQPATPFSGRKPRPAKRLTTTDEEPTPEKKANRSLTPKKFNSTVGDEKAAGADAATPGKNKTVSETDATTTPSTKGGDVSVASATSQSSEQADSTTREEEKEEKVEEEDEEELPKSGTNRSGLGPSSRKSLPAVGSAKERQAKVARDAAGAVRKSLPAGTKMQFTEELTTGAEEQKQSLEKSANGSVNEGAAGKVGAPPTSDEEEFYEASESIIEQEEDGDEESNEAAKDYEKEEENEEDVVKKSSAVAANPARKSLPLASLISAQFYLGGTKKEKRNTIAGVETVGATSTPNQKQPAKGKKNAVTPSANLVANPFALAAASGKAKLRVSMDSATVTAGQDAEQEQTTTATAVGKVKKNRKSLPAMKLDAKAATTDSIEVEKADGAGSTKLDEPEPMEVDEYVEEQQGGEQEASEDEEQDSADEESEDATSAAAEKPKKPTTVTKRLADFDFDSILQRCNEVVREDKERKKQIASLAHQRRVEKKRLRQLREEQEKQISKATEETAGEHAGNGATVGDETTVRNATASSANDEDSQRDEDPAKKKKKRKPKVKNYVLEEMAELKSDRVSEALLRKMESIEARKQRKKERRAEKMKLLNKENGHVQPTAGVVDGGIAAKLQKVAKKKQRQEEAAAAAAAKDVELKQPVVRAAVSAFAVFQQLQNGQPQVNPEASEKNSTADTAAAKPSKGKQSKHVAKKLHTAEQEAKAEQPKGVKAAKKTQNSKVDESSKQAREDSTSVPRKEEALVKKTPTADDVIVSKKKADGKGMIATTKAASESHVELQRQTAASSEVPIKQGKQKKQKKNAELVEEMDAGIPEEQPAAVGVGKTKKQKKNKADKLAFAAEALAVETKKASKAKDATSMNDVPEKKKVPIGGEKTNATKESMVESALREMRAVLDSESGLTKKNKKASALKKREAHDDGGDASVVAKAAGSLPKKRKRDVLEGSTAAGATPRPTKLRALQRADRGFVEETITPDKTRLKRNFGFEEIQSTPKAVGFKVSALQPTDDLRALAADATKSNRRMKAAKGPAPEPNRTLPLPVWTRSGYFLEEAPGESTKKKPIHGDGAKKQTNVTADSGSGSSYVALKGHSGFKLSKLRTVPTNGAGAASSTQLNRIDPDTVPSSVANFKRQQLLERTAHLREKKPSALRLA